MGINKTFLFFIFISLFFSCNDSEVNEKKKFKGTERTIALLTKSTEAKSNDVSIFFYGQSIIGGLKSEILIDSLRKAYPYANIKFKNKAIGGFTIPYLIKTIDHDLFNENPDLIIFHAYDGIKDGLYDALIKKIRKRLNSDILLLNHHYVWDKPESKLASINRSQSHDSDVIKEIAKKYDCDIVNVRAEWKDYLDDNKVSPSVLMGNGVDSDVHPNKEGNILLRSIILNHLLNKESDYNIQKDVLREVKRLNDNKSEINLNLTGNRFILNTERAYNKNARIAILVNDKRPSSIASNYSINRPSKGYKSWMPAIINVSFGDKFPQEEKWSIEIFSIDRTNKTFKFKLYGSKTGYDGQGSSEMDFLSDSKRIKFAKEDFIIFKIEKITKAPIKNNFKINFEVKLLVRDTLDLQRRQEHYLIYRASNKENIKLKLKVISGEPNFKSITSLSPYLQ